MAFIRYPWPRAATTISYPFVPPVAPAYLSSVFADASIVGGDGRYRLHYFNMPDEHTITAVQLQVINNNNDMFFADNTDYATEYSVSTFGDWKLIKADNVTEERFVRLLLHSEDIPEYPFILDASVNGLLATFVGRVHEPNVEFLRSIEVTDANTGITHVLSGEVEIQGGFNVGLITGGPAHTSQVFDHSNARVYHRVVTSAVPGSGMGKVPGDCAELEQAVRRFGAMGPDFRGNVNLMMSGTLRAGMGFTGTEDVIIRNNKEVLLDNDGVACCTCEEYAEAYNALLGLQNNAKSSAGVLMDLNGVHTNIVNTMRVRMPQVQYGRSVVVQLTPKTGWVLSITLIHVNFTNEDVMPITEKLSDTTYGLEIEIDEDDAGKWRLVEGSPYGFNLEVKPKWFEMPYKPEEGGVFGTDPFDPENPDITDFKVKSFGYMAVTYEVLFYEADKREHLDEVTVKVTGEWGLTDFDLEEKAKILEPLNDGEE